MKKVALFLSVLFTLSSLIACVQKEPGESMLQSDLLVSEELSTDNSEISVAESDSSEDYVSKDDISIPDTSEDPSQAETSIETSKEDISKGDTSQKEESEVPKPSISLNPNSLEMRTGDTYKISPTVSGTGGATLTYKSSNSAVATVDTSGNVNAKSAGIAVITVSVSGVSAKLTITVKTKEKAYPDIKGSFIQYGPFLNYSDAQLEKHFDYLKEAGIEYLVLFTSAYQNKDGSFSTVYYPSELAKKNKGSNYNDSNKNITERMLKECQKHGIKAYISPNYSDDGWGSYGISDSNWYKKFANDSVAIAREMYDLYKDKYSDVLYGWYFVPEFANNFSGYNQTLYNNASDMLNIYIDGINKINPSMPFLISPYFVDRAPYSNAVDTAKAWDTIFSKVRFRKGDIFCPQDCVGSGLASTETFVNYYSEFKKVVDKYDNLSFWGNPESFKQSNWTSAPITRFVYQLEKAEPYVEGFISFAYSHYYAPDVKGTPIFHNAYKKYYETGDAGYYSANLVASSQNLSATPTTTGVKLSASFKNCKYGISYAEIYRGNELLGVAHTPELKYADSVLTFDFSDNAIISSGSYKYTFKVFDFLGKNVGEISKTIQVKALNNVSIGKTYTIDYNGNNGYPDDGKKMTDGKYAMADTYSDKNASGFADVANVSFAIDLKSNYDITTVVARALNSGSGGAIVCQNIIVEFSTDGKNFSNKISVDATKYPEENGYTVVEFPVAGVSARYVKVTYEGLRNWLFIDEISVYSK